MRARTWSELPPTCVSMETLSGNLATSANILQIGLRRAATRRITRQTAVSQTPLYRPGACTCGKEGEITRWPKDIREPLVFDIDKML